MDQGIFDINAVDGIVRKSHLTEAINPHGNTQAGDEPVVR